MSETLGELWDDTKWAGHEVIWRRLRGLRHNPPGFANAPGARRSVFGAALEQSEQLFTAARSVDFAARPILLFYGLSQAGRAIAAASTLANGSSWQLAGHGIETIGLNQGRQLHAVELRDQGSGSFMQLAPLLRSDSLPVATALGQIWATIPDLPRLHPGNAEYLPVVRLSTQRVLDPSSPRLTGVLHGLPLRIAELNTNEEIESFLQAYPTLAGHIPNSDAALAVPRPETQTADVPRAWPLPDDRDVKALERRLTAPYANENDRYVFPAIGESIPLHPLLAWWAVLFGLSMLARYESAVWIRYLNVDRSADAVPLETALTYALKVCPQLIFNVIGEVSQPQDPDNRQQGADQRGSDSGASSTPSQ